MTTKNISDLPASAALSGLEPIETMNGATNVQTTTRAIANLAGAASAGAVKVRSVGAIGDSITQKNQLLFECNGKTAAQLYAITDRTWQAGCWLLYGAMRSSNAWFAWDFNPGFSGGTTAQVLASVLPVFLGYPNGLPDACIVLAGTNDVGQSVPLATTLANLKAIYTQLQVAGVQPIAMTIPPRGTFPQNTLQLNLGILRLAGELQIPLIDIYSSSVNPANGFWVSANLTYDNTHPTPLACAIWGYAVNEAIREWFQPAPNKVMTAVYAAALGGTLQNPDPMFQSFAGTINTSSSYPNSTDWGAPGTAAICKMNNAAGTEPGSGLTMRQGTPAVAGSSLTPNYLGNSFTLAGNGAAAYTSNNHGTFLTYAVGDRIALAFNVKAILQQGQTNAGTWTFILQDSVLGGLGGVFYGNSVGSIVVNGQAQVGSESAYPAGEFYTEITIPAGAGGVGSVNVHFGTTAGGATSNVGDSVTFANPVALNLTQLGIVTP